jgi:hypothetical protein
VVKPERLVGLMAVCSIYFSPGHLPECPWTTAMHISEYLIPKNLNVYFRRDVYAGESENQGL